MTTYNSQDLNFGPTYSDASTVALSNVEVAQILGTIRNDLEANDRDVSDNLRRTLEYCDRMGRHSVRDTNKVEETRFILQEKQAADGRKLHTFEIAQLINLGPFEEVEIALLLIGSLKNCDDAFLKEVVTEVNKLNNMDMDL